LVAAFTPGAAVRADFRFVGEEPGFLEFADQRGEFLRGQRLLQRSVAGSEVALRQLVRADERLAREIQHEVEALAAHRVGARKVDRADLAAGGHAIAVRLALREIDLVAVVDRAFRAGANAGVAARADLEIDRVFLPPLELESAEPARKRVPFSRLEVKLMLARDSPPARQAQADLEL